MTVRLGKQYLEVGTMRLGKERSAGYVADVETDEIQETLTAPETAAPELAVSEPVAQERETAPTAG